ncbi:MAG TPA: hypothetical protein VN843_18485, partial [Anaerolineales bacterium]|nr:hypothetical protein [Anaerolineales bacterium]
MSFDLFRGSPYLLSRNLIHELTDKPIHFPTPTDDHIRTFRRQIYVMSRVFGADGWALCAADAR